MTIFLVWTCRNKTISRSKIHTLFKDPLIKNGLKCTCIWNRSSSSKICHQHRCHVDGCSDVCEICWRKKACRPDIVGSYHSQQELHVSESLSPRSFTNLRIAHIDDVATGSAELTPIGLHDDFQWSHISFMKLLFDLAENQKLELMIKRGWDLNKLIA